MGWYKYKIDAFISANPKNIDQIKYGIYLLRGLNIGLNLPTSSMPQFQAGEPWEVVEGPQGEPGSLGGHCVYVVGYDATHVTCVTWGRRHKMSWDFFVKYCDEAYIVCDTLNKWMDTQGFNLELMREQLNKISTLS